MLKGPWKFTADFNIFFIFLLYYLIWQLIYYTYTIIHRQYVISNISISSIFLSRMSEWPSLVKKWLSVLPEPGLTVLLFSLNNVQSANRWVFPLACLNVRFVFNFLQTPCHVAGVESSYAKSTWLASASARFVKINHSDLKWNEWSDFYWKKCCILAYTAENQFWKGTSKCTKLIAINARATAASQVASSSLANRLRRCDTWLNYTARPFGRATLTPLQEVWRDYIILIVFEINVWFALMTLDNKYINN